MSTTLPPVCKAPIDCKHLLSPEYYGAHGFPYETWDKIRMEDPIYRVEDWDGPPYWVLTRYEDIVRVSKSPDIFKNEPRGTMQPQGKDQMKSVFRSLLLMDSPEHRQYRSLVSQKFTPASMSHLSNNIDEFTREVIAEALVQGEAKELEFVESISARIPVWVIAEMLGVPREDWNQLYNWTNILVGADDPEFREGITEEEARAAVIEQLFSYFSVISGERRKNPKEDLISDLVHADIDGKPLNEYDLMSYYALLLAAGNETTRNAITGGIMVLVNHPEQFRKLKSDLGLLDQFVEETLRYVSPVVQMVRTPNVDVELGGKLIKAGEPLVLFFPAANRDEAVFKNPNEFDMERSPNPHLAFGIGEHFCLGTHLARMELRVVFRQLVTCLKTIEIVDEPDRLINSVVGGIKRLNIRYEMESI